MDEPVLHQSPAPDSDPVVQLEKEEAEAAVVKQEEEPVQEEDAGDETGDPVDGEDGAEQEEEEEEDEDEDDDVQINIGDYKPGSLSLTPGPININIKKAAAATGATKAKVVAVDLNAEGTINGESIYDFNVDSIEEKPWTKPGADITDYFNYGFTEDNWKLYCLKQRKLRMEVAEDNMHQSSGPSVPKPGHYNARVPDSIVNENSKYSGQQLKPLGAGPPPGRKQCGSIDVIGTLSGGIPSRRPMDQNDFDSNPNKIQVLSRPPPLGPPPPFNMNMPPPHLMHGMDGGYIPRMPPPGMMPPNGQSMPFHPDFHPPPRFLPPPPSQMMNESPRGGYNDEYDDRPDDRERDYGGYMRGGSQRGSRGGGYERSGYRADEGDFRRGPPTPHSYDRRELDQRDYEIRDYEQNDRSTSSQIRSEREERSESKEGHERSSSRSHSHRERDRERDREHKSREKDADREKERSDSSSSSKRRHHDDDSKSSSSSRHKHSKRSRRDKEDESSSSSKH